MRLLLVKFASRVDVKWFESLSARKEIDDILQRLHAINLKVIDHGGLAHVLNRHEKPLELLFPRFDGDGQSTANRLQRPVEAQFADNHIAFQFLADDASAGS